MPVRAKNRQLSAFLTGKRAEISPASVGIEVTGPRRVPGLRREEVAFLAGVSLDWYVRLEQGQPVTPSEQVLEAVADTLRLNEAEREYLINLARPASGRRAEDPGLPTVRPGVARMIRAFSDQPAFVLGPRMEVLDGNDLAWALLADFPSRPDGQRNLLRWVFTDPATRSLYLDWDVIASELVGVLQLESATRPHDVQIAAIVDELSAVSKDFRAWWARPAPQGRTSGIKRFNHPAVGLLTIEWEAFTLQDDDTQMVFIYTAADADSLDSIRRMRQWWQRTHRIRTRAYEKGSIAS
ncbi:helix-turn-helix transcriptional regulator [Actinomyces sp. MRS3W]|uniref:helix-turn-helix transcriptional regulator n=1 Tax=Actinomyces sp. MRS3W TaxID=2800796 RepID=UPI0028FD6D94|nr:helix-turn-helix transcriptional regulator [Actinomyces sp. MRS3W]MDU0347280.1 helix-turn-helix transcriptional regulator [Actinomyces sp. MRS3W]